MEPIKWRDKLSIDNGIIDDDHRHLIEIINKFHFRATEVTFSSVEQLIDILDELKYYAETHFRREEELQKIAGYPYQDAHRQTHAHLILQLENLTAETAQASGSYIGAMTDKIAVFLHDWLINHVVKGDVQMKPFIAKMRSHAATMGRLADTSR